MKTEMLSRFVDQLSTQARSTETNKADPAERDELTQSLVLALKEAIKQRDRAYSLIPNYSEAQMERFKEVNNAELGSILCGNPPTGRSSNR